MDGHAVDHMKRIHDDFVERQVSPSRASPNHSVASNDGLTSRPFTTIKTDEVRLQELMQEMRLLQHRIRSRELENGQGCVTEPVDESSPRVGEAVHRQYKPLNLPASQPSCSTDNVDPPCPVIHQTVYQTNHLPKVELAPFNGNVVIYWNFIRQFEEYIESQVKDAGQRFLYLQHYCKGKAGQAIEGCVILPREEAYYEARKILHEMYGRPHQLARSLLDNLFAACDRLDSAEDLHQLSLKMQNCETSLSQMRYTSDLEAMHTIETIVRKLPSRLRYGWAKVADDIDREDRDPSFRDLRQFVQLNARIGLSRFGCLAREAPRRNLERDLHKPIKGNDARNVWSVQNVDSHCAVCQQTHSLDSCPEFTAADLARKWELTRKTSSCFNCLKSSHIAKHCKLRARCTVTGCRESHHTLLHGGSSSTRLAEIPEVNCSAINLILTTQSDSSLERPSRRSDCHRVIQPHDYTITVDTDVLEVCATTMEPQCVSVTVDNSTLEPDRFLVAVTNILVSDEAVTVSRPTLVEHVHDIPVPSTSSQSETDRPQNTMCTAVGDEVTLLDAALYGGRVIDHTEPVVCRVTRDVVLGMDWNVTNDWVPLQHDLKLKKCDGHNVSPSVVAVYEGLAAPAVILESGIEQLSYEIRMTWNEPSTFAITSVWYNWRGLLDARHEIGWSPAIEEIRDNLLWRAKFHVYFDAFDTGYSLTTGKLLWWRDGTPGPPEPGRRCSWRLRRRWKAGPKACCQMEGPPVTKPLMRWSFKARELAR